MSWNLFLGNRVLLFSKLRCRNQNEGLLKKKREKKRCDLGKGAGYAHDTKSRELYSHRRFLRIENEEL